MSSYRTIMAIFVSNKNKNEENVREKKEFGKRTFYLSFRRSL